APIGSAGWLETDVIHRCRRAEPSRRSATHPSTLTYFTRAHAYGSTGGRDAEIVREFLRKADEMTTRSVLAIIVGSIVTGSAACSGSTTLPSPSSLTASVSDAIGDTVILPVLRNGVLLTPVVPIPPDLVGATIDVTSGNLTGTISFAPGTLSQ